jgi:hypothetical protein
MLSTLARPGIFQVSLRMQSMGSCRFVSSVYHQSIVGSIKILTIERLEGMKAVNQQNWRLTLLRSKGRHFFYAHYVRFLG